jgi:uncharacterized protein YqfA (UPF0365 family)
MPIFLLIAVGVVGLVFAVVLINFFGLWLRALTSGAPVGIPTLIAMRLRGIPNSLIVNARITFGQELRFPQHNWRLTTSQGVAWTK